MPTYTGPKSLTFSGASSSTNPVVAPTVRNNAGTDVTFGSPTAITFTNGVAMVIGGNNGAMKLYKAEIATISVTDDSISSSGVDRLQVTVSPSSLAKFLMNLTSPQTNGQVFTGTNTVTAQDTFGNTVTNFNASTNNVSITTNLAGTVSGLGSGGNNVLNQASNFVSGVANLTTLGMKYTGTTGTGTFTATSASGKTGSSQAVTINVGPASKLVYVQQPTMTPAGEIISPPVTVQLKDAGNNNVMISGVSVTISLTSGTGTLNGTKIKSTNSNGLATFDNLSIDAVGSKALTATSSGLTPAVSNSFDITPSSKPSIAIWYGKRQTFGKLGLPQRWVNILGTVSDPDGINSLQYTLNGGASVPLSLGPDRRLAGTGDFNIDMSYSELTRLPDSNRVVITVVDGLSNVARDTVIVRYVGGTVWPLPYSTNWASATSLQDSAQVVDGLWAKDAIGIHPTRLGYSRFVAIGDTTWRDYEVTVPITIHSIDSSGYNSTSAYPSVGILMRWMGHTDDPEFDPPIIQPQSGYNPFGAIGYYSWKNDAGGERLEMFGNRVQVVVDDQSGKKLLLNVAYNFKMRVHTTAQGGIYSLKVWQAGQTEPALWDLTYQATLSDPQKGSFVLIAHHVDASFGRVTVRLPVADSTPPTITQVNAIPGRTTAAVTWTTDEQSTSKVEYGLTTAYGNTMENPLFVINHSVILTGLSENALYHYRVTSVDIFGNGTTTTDRTFTTKGTSSIVSDGFNLPALDTRVWTFVNPLGDGAQMMTGTQLAISVPAGAAHDPWTGGNNAPRVMQPANDTDFLIEAKFDSPMSLQFQITGLIVQENLTNYLRFDVNSDGTNTRIFAAGILNNVATAITSFDDVIAANGFSPLRIRVMRERNSWGLHYSLNGTDWIEASSFTYDMIVTAVGVFAANSGGAPPAYTAIIDYFLGSLPFPPALRLPANNATNQPVNLTLTWTRPISTTTFRFQLSTDSTFSSGMFLDDSTIVDTFKVVSGLLNRTKYFWRVRARSGGGWGPYSTPWSFTTIGTTSAGEDGGLPKEYSLSQNYPNPFNPSTVIPFAIPKESHVKLEVYNLLGQKVATLLDETRVAGYYTIRFDPAQVRGGLSDRAGLSSGVYFYRLFAGEVSFLKKMLLIQ